MSPINRMAGWAAGRPLSAVFLIAVVTRLAWIRLTASSVPVDDAAWYLSAAQRLFTDHAYSFQGHATAYWPVGYPFFLSLFMGLGAGAGAAILAVQACLSALTAVMIFDLVAALRHDRAAAWACALGFAFFPSSLSLASLFLSETLFAFLLFAAFWGAIRRPGWAGVVVCSLAVSAACYVRPVALILFPLPFARYLVSGGAAAYLYRTGAVAFAILLTALPWAYRNYSQFGGVSLYATNMGANLIIGHNAEATGSYMDPPILDSMERAVSNELERSRRLQDAALAYARENPGRELRLLAIKFWRLLVPERTEVYASFITGPDRDFPAWARMLAVGNNLYYWAWLALFLSVPAWRSARTEPAVFACWLAFWSQIAFYCLFFAADRYKFPAMPFLFTLASHRLPGGLPGVLAKFRARGPKVRP